MSIASVVTRGYGSFGTIGLVVTAGYSSAEGAGEVVTPPAQVVLVGDGVLSWQEYVTAEFKRRHLLKALDKEESKLKKVEKRIVQAKKKIKYERTEGILANLFEMEMKRDEIENKIRSLRVEMIPLEAFFEAEIDEDDEEVMLLQ